MNVLRANGGHTDGWWEIRLLDLDIFAEGDSEKAMLADLERTLVSEYYLATRRGETPFVSLLLARPVRDDQCWDEDPTRKARGLNLPAEVSQALAAVFERPTLADFSVELNADNMAA